MTLHSRRGALRCALRHIRSHQPSIRCGARLAVHSPARAMHPQSQLATKSLPVSCHSWSSRSSSYHLYRQTITRPEVIIEPSLAHVASLYFNVAFSGLNMFPLNISMAGYCLMNQGLFHRPPAENHAPLQPPEPVPHQNDAFLSWHHAIDGKIGRRVPV